jgi:hypothetical protein
MNANLKLFHRVSSSKVRDILSATNYTNLHELSTEKLFFKFVKTKLKFGSKN